MGKKGIRIYSLIMVFVIWFNLFNGVSKTQVEDPGVGWHLRTGEWVLQHHAVPKVDPFLATEKALSWVSDQWLSDVILFKIYQSASWLGLNLLPQFVFFTFFFCILFISLRRIVGHGLAAGLGIACVMRYPLVHYVCRPVIFSFIGFSLVYCFLLEKQFLNGNKTIDKWDYLKLGLIFLFWTNLHPSFVLGLALMGLYFAALLCNWIVLEREVSLAFIGKFLMLMLFSLLVTLINPYFYHLHQSIFELAGSEFFMNLNMEWFPLSFHAVMDKALLVLFLIIPLAALLKRDFFREWGCFECGIILLAFHFMTQHVRMLPYIAILLSYPLTISAKAIMEYLYEKTPWFLSYLKRLYDDCNYDEEHGRSLHWYATAGLFAVFCFSPTVFIEKEALGLPTHANCPREPIAFLREQVKDKPIKLYGSPNYGGCITHFGDRKVLAIMDDRNTMLGEKPYKRYMKMEESAKNFRKGIRKIKPDYAIVTVEPDTHGKLVFDEFSKMGVPVVYKDKDYAVYSFSDIVKTKRKKR